MGSVGDVYRSLLDNGAIEQVKEITLLGVWRYEKKAVFREVTDPEMGVNIIFHEQHDTVQHWYVYPPSSPCVAKHGRKPFCTNNASNPHL